MKAYFTFSRKEKIGAITLASLIVVLTVILNVNNHRDLPDPRVLQSNFSFESEESLINGDQQSLDQISPSSLKDDNGAYQLFDFDPNELNRKGWQKLGFSEKQSESIVNYREKFGPFKSPDDVNKIYVISDDKFNEIEPYMVFNENALAENESFDKVLININSATQEELESIKGIGPAFSSRTIKYRNALGGYVSKEQFHEIYGMNEDAFEALSENVQIDMTVVEKIKINQDSKTVIRNHPYLNDWAIVTSIIDKRSKQKIEDLNFLIDEGLMEESKVNKLAPYISFE